MFAVVGEALLDLVQPEPNGPFRAIPGGSPLNIAVGLRRLGHPTQMVARLSRGGLGSIVREHAERNGLALDHCVVADAPTTLAFASLNAAGQASYEFYVHGTADWGWTEAELATLPLQTQAVHTGSMAAFIEPGADVILDMLERERAEGSAVVSFDPNVRPDVVGAREAAVARAERFVRVAHVVKASDEDLAWLYPGVGPAESLARWAAMGPAVVVMTRGADGCVAQLHDDDGVELAGVRVDVVDTIGAGDAFASGLLSGIADAGFLAPERIYDVGAPALRVILDRAVMISAMTCQRAGADPPTMAEYDAAMAARAVRP